MGNPYVRLWSLVDQPTAAAEFHSIRGGTAQPYTSSTTAPVNAAAAQPNTPTGANNDSGSTTVSADQTLVKNVNTLVSYVPIALGVLGLNAVLLLVLCGFAITFMCKRKKGGKKGRLAVNVSQPSLGRAHSYQQVKGEDLETPMTPLKFSDAQARASASAASLRYDAAQTPNPLINSDEAEATAVNESFRLSTLGKDGGLTTPLRASIHSRSSSKVSVVTTPGSATFKPSNLSNMSMAGSPGPSPTKSSSGAAQDLLLPPSSPANGSDPLPASDNASLRSHQSVPQVSVAPPDPLSRTQEHLAAMEARRAALGVDSSRRNTFQYSSTEPLDPPPRRFQGVSPDRRALSAYIDDSVQREPLQRPVRLQDPHVPDTADYVDAYDPPESPSTLQLPSEHQAPPVPSRSQAYLAAMEARRAALAGQQDPSKRLTYHDDSQEVLQTPSRRFRGAAAQDDGRRATYVEGADNSQRETIYFDAAGSPHSEGMQTPFATRGPQASHDAPASPLSGRSGPGSSMMESPGGAFGPPEGPSSASPSRPNFAGNTLLPPSGLGSSRSGGSAGDGYNWNQSQPQARPGSYAGYSTSTPQPGMRMPSNLGPQGMRIASTSRFNPQQQGEEDLADQMRRPEFEERVDAFADAPPGARPPRAPFANPGYRYSTA